MTTTTAQAVTLIDGDDRRTQLLRGDLAETYSIPRKDGDRWKLHAYVRAPEMDHPGNPPAYVRVD